jgi:hypothetical protein
LCRAPSEIPNRLPTERAELAPSICGRPDILFTALAGETFPLFRNAGNGNFTDATLKSRVGQLMLRHSGWGVGLFDFNNDGWKDIFCANSHVNDRVELFETAEWTSVPGGSTVNRQTAFALTSSELRPRLPWRLSTARRGL